MQEEELLRDGLAASSIKRLSTARNGSTHRTPRSWRASDELRYLQSVCLQIEACVLELSDDTIQTGGEATCYYRKIHYI